MSGGRGGRRPALAWEETRESLAVSSFRDGIGGSSLHFYDARWAAEPTSKCVGRSRGCLRAGNQCLTEAGTALEGEDRRVSAGNSAGFAMCGCIIQAFCNPVQPRKQQRLLYDIAWNKLGGTCTPALMSECIVCSPAAGGVRFGTAQPKSRDLLSSNAVRMCDAVMQLPGTSTGNTAWAAEAGRQLVSTGAFAVVIRVLETFLRSSVLSTLFDRHAALQAQSRPFDVNWPQAFEDQPF